MPAFEYSISVKSHRKLVSLVRELSEIGMYSLGLKNSGSVTGVYKIGKHDVVINHSSVNDNRIRNYRFEVGSYHEPASNSTLSNWLKKHKAKPKHASISL